MLKRNVGSNYWVTFLPNFWSVVLRLLKLASPLLKLTVIQRKWVVLRDSYSRVTRSLMTSETSSIVLFSFHSPLFQQPHSSLSPSLSSSLTIKSMLLCLRMHILISNLIFPRGRNAALAKAYHITYLGRSAVNNWRKHLLSNKKAGEIQGNK